MAVRFADRVILLFGARGQLGRELQHTLSGLASVLSVNFPDADFNQPGSLKAVIRKHRPDVIVNAAAYTAVDKAESEAERVFAINAVSPGVLAREAEVTGACLIHYSTDYVFDGRKSSPYVETDAPNPLSTYGRSKLEGEHGVTVCRRHLIFRTSWVVGVHGQNFVKTILRLAGERDTLRVVNDQLGAPTSAALLSEVTAKVLAHMLEQPPSDARWGLYHLVAGGETSWHGLANHIIGRARAMGFHSRVRRVVPIPTTDYPLPAMRPANSRLDTSKLRSTFALALPDWTSGVNDILSRLLPEMKP